MSAADAKIIQTLRRWMYKHPSLILCYEDDDDGNADYERCLDLLDEFAADLRGADDL